VGYVRPTKLKKHRRRTPVGAGRAGCRARECRTHPVGVVRENRPARRLYESVGFSEFGIEPKASKIGDKYFDEAHLALDFSRPPDFSKKSKGDEQPPRSPHPSSSANRHGARGAYLKTIETATLGRKLGSFERGVQARYRRNGSPRPNRLMSALCSSGACRKSAGSTDAVIIASAKSPTRTTMGASR
jgi:hypothetical protein